jgi:hypothetical protein
MLSSLYKNAARTALKRSANGSTRGFAKEIKFGIEGRAAMLKGVDTLADAVQVRKSLYMYHQYYEKVTCDTDIFSFCRRYVGNTWAEGT